MVTPNGIKLAVYLISSYFGDLTSKVIECLLRRGTLTVSQITRFTELDRENVKNCLLVLVQHNCVQAYAVQHEAGFGETPKVLTQYIALFDNIIHHMRFPKFMEIVSKELGKECEELFEALLQHGRLSLHQIMDRHKQTSKQGNDNVDAARDIFNKLVNSRFVERCPSPEPFLAPSSEEESSAKKRGGKFKKAEEVVSIEQHALRAAAPMESVRFLIETDLSSGASEKKSDEEPTSVKVGEKRKNDSLEQGTEHLSVEGKKKVLWRVNFDEFILRLRHKACVENVRARFDNETAIVLSAVLELSRGSSTKVKAENSAPLSIDAIRNEVIKKEGGLSMSFLDSLAQLGCDIPLIETDETCSIDFKRIIELAQLEEVESIVKKKYGSEAYRIFRLLSRADRLLETDKISDTTFVERKDTIKILFKLWKDDYLEMEKIRAQLEFLLWKINKKSLWKHVLDEMYHAVLNLRLRIAYEQEKEKEMLQLPRDKLVGEMAQRYKRWRKVRIILESSFMDLDDAVMLLNDF